MKELSDKLEAELRRGVLQIAALALMREDTYGYKLGKDLARHGLDIEEGTLYPILRRLESKGLLASEWDTSGKRPRKYYRTTDEGWAAARSLYEESNDEIIPTRRPNRPEFLALQIYRVIHRDHPGAGRSEALERIWIAQ